MFGGLFEGDADDFIGPSNAPPSFSNATRGTAKYHVLPSHEIARRGDSRFVGQWSPLFIANHQNFSQKKKKKIIEKEFKK